MKTMNEKTGGMPFPPDGHRTGRSATRRGIFRVLALCVVLVPAAASAQGWWWGSRIDAGYDPKTVIDVRGTVVEVYGAEQGGTASLSLKADGEGYTVVLGPAWHLNKQGIRFGKGDTLRVRGSRMADRQGKVFLVAATVFNERTGEEFRLRDDSGVPLWSRKGRRGR